MVPQRSVKRFSPLDKYLFKLAIKTLKRYQRTYKINRSATKSATDLMSQLLDSAVKSLTSELSEQVLLLTKKIDSQKH